MCFLVSLEGTWSYAIHSKRGLPFSIRLQEDRMKIYYDSDADLGVLNGKKVAIIGSPDVNTNGELLCHENLPSLDAW